MAVEGDRLAARERFVKRGTEGVSAFDAHVGNLSASWDRIAVVVGDNIIWTIDATGRFLPPEEIFDIFFSGFSADAAALLARVEPRQLGPCNLFDRLCEPIRRQMGISKDHRDVGMAQ